MVSTEHARLLLPKPFVYRSACPVTPQCLTRRRRRMSPNLHNHLSGPRPVSLPWLARRRKGMSLNLHNHSSGLSPVSPPWLTRRKGMSLNLHNHLSGLRVTAALCNRLASHAEPKYINSEIHSLPIHSAIPSFYTCTTTVGVRIPCTLLSTYVICIMTSCTLTPDQSIGDYALQPCLFLPQLLFYTYHVTINYSTDW